MIITINVNVNAPELASALLTVAGAFSSAPKKLEIASKSETLVKTQPSKTAQALTPTPAQEPTSEPELTLEEVRAKLASLTQSGKQAEVKALIEEFNASKLTEVPKERYAELMEKAKTI